MGIARSEYFFNVQIKGRDGVIRIEEKNDYGSFQGKLFLVEKHICLAYGLLKWSLNQRKMDLKLIHRRPQKSPTRGQTNWKKHMFDDFPSFLLKRSKKTPCVRYCLMFKRVPFYKSRKLQQPFSRGCPKRGNPTMTTSTITARRKGYP